MKKKHKYLNKRNKKEKEVLSSVNIEKLSLILCEKMKKDLDERRHLGAKQILKLVAAGVFSLLDFYPSNLIRYAKPYLQDPEAGIVWERFNIPYLKRILKRLEKQKLVEIEEKNGKQIVKINERGKVKILKYSIEELELKKPDFWDGKWWLVSYDLPEELSYLRKIVRQYFLTWGFYPLHKSVYLHAYPCKEEITFLREYLGIGEYIKVFKVVEIENDKIFRDFFGV